MEPVRRHFNALWRAKWDSTFAIHIGARYLFMNMSSKETFSANMIRAALATLSVLALSGCLMMVMAVARTQPDAKANFEGTAEGRLFSDYTEACYWNRQYDPLRSLCGRLVETRESPEGIEYVHALKKDCVYGFLVDRKTRIIKSWRYISAPEGCRLESPASEAG